MNTQLLYNYTSKEYKPSTVNFTVLYGNAENVCESKSTPSVKTINNGLGNIIHLESFTSLIHNRMAIKQEFGDLVTFDTENDEIDFIAENKDLINLLPNLCQSIKLKIRPQRIGLELFEESRELRTLFIKVYSDINWEKANEFQDEFYEIFIQNPQLEKLGEKLNIEFIPV